jgi:uncharacterized protein YPO0396
METTDGLRQEQTRQHHQAVSRSAQRVADGKLKCGDWRADQRKAQMILRREQRLGGAEPVAAMQIEDIQHLRIQALVGPVQLAALHDEDHPQHRGERQQQNEGTPR